MAALDFPSAPTIGQYYVAGNGVTYQWNGTMWLPVGGSAALYIGETPPPTPGTGQLWFNSADARLYVYYNDGNTTQWVPAAPIPAPWTGNAITVIRTFPFLTTQPWTPHPLMVQSQLETWGGGAAGGGCPATASTGAGGSGGGAGGYSRRMVMRAAVTPSQVVTIGAAGVGGTGIGGNGGVTSIGALCVANGGTGGAAGVGTGSYSGGPGGVPGTGDIAAPGQAGHGGQGTNASLWPMGGNGGSTSVGAGGRGSYLSNPTAASSAGGPATGYGAGGGGATSFNAGAYVGGNGTPGYSFITEYCSG